MKKRKLAAGGYLPNYGDEQPQNPFGPSVINPTGQDMGLPSMGNPYDPYEQGYRHGGKVKMAKKKMAEGGMSETTSTPPVLRGQQRRAAEDPEFAKRLANQAAYRDVQAGRRQFAILSPERQNYGAFMQMEQDKYRSAMGGRGAPVGTYTAGTYNPATSYTTQLIQQRAAADAAKKAAMPVKRAKGGMADGGIAPGSERRVIDPQRQLQEANKAALQAGQIPGMQYTPDSQNYRAFRQLEKAKYKAATFPGRDGAIGEYKTTTFNPSVSYTTQLAAADAAKAAARPNAAKKAADQAEKLALRGTHTRGGGDRGVKLIERPNTGIRMAKGGMASSASKRADGCAVKGKTKCKMR